MRNGLRLAIWLMLEDIQEPCGWWEFIGLLGIDSESSHRQYSHIQPLQKRLISFI